MTTTSEGHPVLAAELVTMEFGGLTALSEVTLNVPAASVIGLVGPNGAGKSTLFNVMSGFLDPTAGRVLIDGTDVTRQSPQRRARMRVARTFQQPELFEDLTIREHLLLARIVSDSPRGMWLDVLKGAGLRRSLKTNDDTVDALIKDLSLGEDANRLAVGLPLGVARRVEVGRALATSPRVVLLDEPSSGLDEAETTELADVLKSAQARDVSLVLVEHDVDLVLGLSDYVYVLDFGKVIAEGTPAAVRSNPKVIEAYLGDDPGLNKAEAGVRK